MTFVKDADELIRKIKQRIGDGDLSRSEKRELQQEIRLLLQNNRKESY